MPGFYPAVAKLRAYLLRLVGSAAREKACWRWWQIPSRFARTERARDEGRERKLVDSIGRSTLGRQKCPFWSIAKSVCEARKNSRATIKIGNQTVMNRVQDGGLAALAPATPIGRKTKQQTITRVLRKLETSLTITASEPALLRRQPRLAAENERVSPCQRRSRLSRPAV